MSTRGGQSVIDKVAWIEIQDRKVLSTLSQGKDTWYFPGGKRERVEDGNGYTRPETDEETLIREIGEELGVLVLRDTIQSCGVFEAQAHGQTAGVIVRMTCYSSAYEGELKPSGEIAELDWITTADNDRVSSVDKLILDDLARRDLID